MLFRSGRVIPVHPDLREALMQLRADHSGTSGAVIASERGGPMRPIAIVAGLPELIAPLGLRVVRRILAAGRLLRERPDWFTRLAPHFGMCSCSLVTGPC